MQLCTAMAFVLTFGISSVALAETESFAPAETQIVVPAEAENAEPMEVESTAQAGTLNATPVEAEIIIKFSHVAAPNTAKGQAVERFKQLAEQSSDGRIRVDIFPNGQLYSDLDEFEALQSGAVQMLAPSFSKFALIGVREFELFDLPYIFPSLEILHRLVDGNVGKSLFTKLSDKGLTGLAYWDNGFKQTSSNRAMHKVTDLKGLRMGIQSSKVLEAQMKAFGMAPQVTSPSKVYSALQQRAIDGTENPVSDFYAQKLYEVQTHLTISNHGYLGYAVIANKTFWAGLPADIRDTLMQAMNEATLFERDFAQKENDEALTNVMAGNTTEVYVLSPRERTTWQRASLPVYQEFEKTIGSNLIKGVARIANQIKKEQDATKTKGKSAPKKTR
ncbi:MAG: DctP family TRAP transporter solute-binding subunit [Gallionella sp.]